MPIIPGDWVGIQSVNLASSSQSITPFKYCKTFEVSIDDLTDYIPIIGYCEQEINRELTLTVIQGKISVYWIEKNNELMLIQQKSINIDETLIDDNLDCLGVAVKVLEPSIFFVTLRWNNDIDFYLYTGDELMIPVSVKLAIGTGNNFTDVNANSYDTNEYQYLINLNKLKNSDSGVTGWKIFDVNCFYPGKPINFNVNISNNTSYDLTSPIALQLFDPLTIGEVLFAVANDVVNLEINNLGDKFIGNLTRNAYYKEVINNSIEIIPDFSKHIGRFVAKNSFTGMYDTAIIESYTPNTDIYKGGTFTLTGKF